MVLASSRVSELMEVIFSGRLNDPLAEPLGQRVSVDRRKATHLFERLVGELVGWHDIDTARM